MSRHIPNIISNTLKLSHYFECAWCGVKLTERHHIKEYSKGGEHSVENLILLCPTCHTQVHNNEIDESDLITRKSTHLKGDRISGGIQFDINHQIVKIGNNLFEDTPIILNINGKSILQLQKVNNDFLLSCMFYDKEDNLIFWMSLNRYWTNSNLTVTSTKNEISISDNNNDNKIKLWIEDEKINVSGKNYINGSCIEYSPVLLKVDGNTVISFNGCKFNSAPVAIVLQI